MKPSFLSNVFIGLAMVGDIVGRDAERAGTSMAMILTDNSLPELMAATYWQVHGRPPVEGEDYMKDAAAIEAHGRLKTFVRNMLQGMINEEERRHQEAVNEHQRLSMQNLQLKLRTSNAPHPEGTVAELAERFKVSKSEIRRRKVDGTLNELLSKDGS